MRDQFLTYIKKNQQGGIFVITLVVMSILFIYGFSLVMLLSVYYKKVISNKHSLKAHYLAEAGIEKAIVDYLIKDADKNWTNNQFLDIYKNEKLGDGNFSVSSKNGNSKSIVVSATGECNDAIKNVKALIAVDWQKDPPNVQLIQWQEQKTDSLQ